MDSLPNFVTHGDPLRALRAREFRYQESCLHYILKEEFQMPQVQGNDGEKGFSKALACTGSGASGEDPRTQASVAPKDQLTDTSSGGMFQTSVHYLAVSKKFFG